MLFHLNFQSILEKFKLVVGMFFPGQDHSFTLKKYISMSANQSAGFLSKSQSWVFKIINIDVRHEVLRVVRNRDFWNFLQQFKGPL